MNIHGDGESSKVYKPWVDKKWLIRLEINVIIDLEQLSNLIRSPIGCPRFQSLDL